MIEQRIREAETNLASAKVTLASLIQRHRSEQKLAAALDGRLAGLTNRASEALRAGREDLAGDAASGIAAIENERTIRRTTIDELDAGIARLRLSVEAAHRRIVDLKQGAITARAVRNEHRSKARLSKSFSGTSAAGEAEELIRRVVDQADPFEQYKILADFDRGLTGSSITKTLEDEKFGPATRATASTVLDRLKRLEDAKNDKILEEYVSETI